MDSDVPEMRGEHIPTEWPLEGSVEPDVTPTAKNTRRYKLVAVLSTIVLFLGLGFVAGWTTHDFLQSRRSSPVPEMIEVPAAVTREGLTVPDLRGMSLTDAKQALTDGGFPLDTVEVTEIEWGGPPETVISQEPVGGETFSSALKLQVSVEAKVPAVGGMPESEAVAALKGLGVEAEVVDVFDFSVPSGTVLSTEPAEGEPLPSVVKLNIAEPGGSLFLENLRPIDRNCSSTAAKINGTEYPRSVACTATRDGDNRTVWLLDRKAYVVSATVGISDEEKPDAQATVVFYGDGRELGRVDASYAVATPITLDVKDILRFEVSVQSHDRSARSVILGDALVKAPQAEIDALDTK